MTHYIITLLIGICSCIFLFAPPKTSAAMLGIRWQSKVWAKLVGAMGLVWLALGFMTKELAGNLKLTEAGQSALLMFKSVCGGIIIGLLVAICTRRFEDH